MLDTNGKTVNLSDFKNKVLVVYFWSTWCYYCHKEFPMVNRVVKQYAHDTTVAFLFVDTREKSADYKILYKRHGEDNYNFHVVFDEKGKDSIQTNITQHSEQLVFLHDLLLMGIWLFVISQ
ncbi:TlpA family protein disulfide reductase [Chitinophaga pinensis]|uniref:TlpA family protein disulfide reductase n=2 Tax=Chitinophaga pinensis TaxID=79329 RepID=A0A5C6LHT9_9BACT|nr:TlpA family protein disulfide reductase [Chitinophaga pinensis]